MGCGTSRSQRLVSPLSKAVVLSQMSWGNSKPFFPHTKLTFNKAVQAAPLEEMRSTQTDPFRYPEEELEMLLEEEEPDIWDMETQTVVDTKRYETTKSVLMQTDEQRRWGGTRHVITIDTGVQASKPKTERSTQTYRIRSRFIDSYVGKALIKMPTMDFESQTDPVTRALAANAAGNDANVLFSTPFTHIQKELPTDTLQETLTRFLEEETEMVPKFDVSVQTINDPVTDEAPEYAARPPPCKKKEMIPTLSVFKELDLYATEIGCISLRIIDSRNMKKKHI